MKFRVRQGWKLFKTADEGHDYSIAGARSGVKPLAVGGDVREFSIDRLQKLRASRSLGTLEPLDDEAKDYFGNTAPMIAPSTTSPHDYGRQHGNIQ